MLRTWVPHFNDNKASCICLFPNKYYIVSLLDFNVVRREVLLRRTACACATARGHKFIALLGQPGDPHFDTRWIVVRDHDFTPTKDIFEKQFERNVLQFRLTSDYLAASFYNCVEVWALPRGEQKASLHFMVETAVTLTGPIGMSGDGLFAIFQGKDPLSIGCLRLATRELVEKHAADNAIQLVQFATPPDIFATASQSGHVVKVWDVETLAPVIKLRRGRLESVLTGVDFSPDLQYALVVSAVRSHLHLFHLGDTGERRAIHKIEVPDADGAVRLVSWFGPDQLAIMTRSGVLLLLTFQLKGDTYTEVGYERVNVLSRIAEFEDKLVEAEARKAQSVTEEEDW